MNMRTIIILAAAGAVLLVAGVAWAISAAGYDLSWWTVDGGGGSASGGTYTLPGTMGQLDAGALSGGDYTLAGGFWGATAAQLPTATPTPSPTGVGPTQTYTPTPTRTPTATPTGPPPLVVNVTDDANDGTCNATHCSLREAARLAGVGDTIAFNIPPTDPGYDPLLGVWTIRPLTTYPLSEAVTLDGATQTASRGDTNPLGPEIELDGSLVDGASGWGFQIGTANNVIRGLTMNRFSEGAIRLFGQGAVNICILGNYLGTDPTGAQDRGNGWGIYIYWGAHGNTIGGAATEDRNLISGNDQGGIGLFGTGADHNLIVGNFIGTNAQRSGALDNTNDGVSIELGADNVIGPGNVIAFNGGDGVRVNGKDTLSNSVTANSIHSNDGLGINNVAGGNLELAPPVITVASVVQVSGTACPGCTVEVFSDHEDEGAVYEGSTVADGSGRWSLYVSLTGPNMTATVTDAAGNTSEFSTPVAVLRSRVYLPLLWR